MAQSIAPAALSYNDACSASNRALIAEAEAFFATLKVRDIRAIATTADIGYRSKLTTAALVKGLAKAFVEKAGLYRYGTVGAPRHPDCR